MEKVSEDVDMFPSLTSLPQAMLRSPADSSSHPSVTSPALSVKNF